MYSDLRLIQNFRHTCGVELVRCLDNNFILICRRIRTKRTMGNTLHLNPIFISSGNLLLVIDGAELLGKSLRVPI